MLQRVKPKYWNGLRLSTRTRWATQDQSDLRGLCESGVIPKLAADALGRSETSIAHRALHLGLKMPPSWAANVSKKNQRAKRPRILTRVRAERAVIEVNRIVPQINGRDDICQEILLAILEGQFSIHDLKSDARIIRRYMSGFNTMNLENRGYVTYLDCPRKDGRSWHDLILVEDPSDDVDETMAV